MSLFVLSFSLIVPNFFLNVQRLVSGNPEHLDKKTVRLSSAQFGLVMKIIEDHGEGSEDKHLFLGIARKKNLTRRRNFFEKKRCYYLKIGQNVCSL